MIRVPVGSVHAGQILIACPRHLFTMPTGFAAAERVVVAEGVRVAVLVVVAVLLPELVAVHVLVGVQVLDAVTVIDALTVTDEETDTVPVFVMEDEAVTETVFEGVIVTVEVAERT